MHLCLNCLEPGAKPYPVGHEKGHQRDPYHSTIDLCDQCKVPLENGDITRFHERYVSSREIERKVPDDSHSSG